MPTIIHGGGTVQQTTITVNGVNTQYKTLNLIDSNVNMPKNDLSFDFQGGTTFTTGDKLYIREANGLYQYIQSNDSWEFKEALSFSHAFRNNMFGIDGDMVYVVTTTEILYKNITEAFPFETFATLPINANGKNMVIVSGNDIYIMLDDGIYTAEYNDVTKLVDLPIANMEYCSLAYVDGHLYSFGGITDTGSTIRGYYKLENDNTWNKLGLLPYGGRLTVKEKDGIVHIITNNNDEVNDRYFGYDVANDEIKFDVPTQYDVEDASIGFEQNKLHLLGGNTVKGDSFKHSIIYSRAVDSYIE